MKERMKAYVLSIYPDARFDQFFETKWGSELHFYPNAGAEERCEAYACVSTPVERKFTILTDF